MSRRYFVKATFDKKQTRKDISVDVVAVERGRVKPNGNSMPALRDRIEQIERVLSMHEDSV